MLKFLITWIFRNYEIFIRKATELYSNSTTTNVTTQTFIDKQPSTVYTVKVSAFDNLGEIPGFGEVTVTTRKKYCSKLIFLFDINQKISLQFLVHQKI